MCTVPITVVTSCFGAVHRVSVVLYWTGEYRKYQILACSDWIGGLYGSPIMGGTKPGNEWDWESLFLLLLLILSLLFLLLLFLILSHSLLFPDFSDSLPTPRSLFCSLVTGPHHGQSLCQWVRMAT